MPPKTLDCFPFEGPEHFRETWDRNLAVRIFPVGFLGANCQVSVEIKVLEKDKIMTSYRYKNEYMLKNSFYSCEIREPGKMAQN